jgi:hypothetical protein
MIHFATIYDVIFSIAQSFKITYTTVLALPKKQNGALPLNLTYPEHLSITVASQLQVNLQLRNN